ncbi:hypothetical protein Cgig2_004288 [Carnegiea gigantea]|uniref:Uncharacterized protein n=1 Tax=Carnegiea gigantea TaxID=171969 RepID=A0A9Q1GTN7_9CARY|nr:hypothetical protein Cgig2_004288 [Carnegiea gigantea]
MLGIPIKIDKTTKEKSTLGYAHILVEMPIEGPFPEHIDLVNDSDRVKPTRCNHCRMLGPEEANCRKEPNLRQEWREKEVQAPEANPVNQQEPDGFISPRARRTISPTQSRPHNGADYSSYSSDGILRGYTNDNPKTICNNLCLWGKQYNKVTVLVGSPETHSQLSTGPMNVSYKRLHLMGLTSHGPTRGCGRGLTGWLLTIYGIKPWGSPK